MLYESFYVSTNAFIGRNGLCSDANYTKYNDLTIAFVANKRLCYATIFPGRLTGDTV